MKDCILVYILKNTTFSLHIKYGFRQTCFTTQPVNQLAYIMIDDY